MVVQPFDIEGQLPVEFNFLTVVTLENFSVRESRQLTHKGSALGITGIAVGIATPTFSFRLPILATPIMTEINAQQLMSSVPKPGQKFVMSFRNSVGARKTMIGCRLGERSYSNTPIPGDAGGEFSGAFEELIDS